MVTIDGYFAILYLTFGYINGLYENLTQSRELSFRKELGIKLAKYKIRKSLHSQIVERRR